MIQLIDSTSDTIREHKLINLRLPIQVSLGGKNLCCCILETLKLSKSELVLSMNLSQVDNFFIYLVCDQELFAYK